MLKIAENVDHFPEMMKIYISASDWSYKKLLEYKFDLEYISAIKRLLFLVTVRITFGGCMETFFLQNQIQGTVLLA